MTRPIAVLRPEPGNAATAARVEALGLVARRVPLFEVHPLDWAAPDPAAYDALILTSANAVSFGGPQLARLQSLPVLAVGAATATAAQAAGFDVIATGDGGAAMVQEMAMQRGLTPALHLGGRDRVLGAGGPVATSIAVYASVPRALSDEDRASLSGTVALLHSRRAAERLCQVVDESGLARATIAIAAFSSAVAVGAGTGWRADGVAETPNDESLLAVAQRLAD